MLATTRFWEAVASGLLVTVSLTVLSMLIGLVAGTGLAFMQAFGRAPLRLLARAYIFVFRGVPVLILLFLAYYGLPQLQWLRGTLFWDLVLSSPYATALMVLSLNNAAYLGEIVRGGLKGVGRGLLEAGAGVGMTPWQVARRIQLPLAFRSIIGSLGNETIAVMKASAVTSVITVQDLMGGPNSVGKVYLDVFTPLLVVGLIYIGLVQLVELGVAALRRRMA